MGVRRAVDLVFKTAKVYKGKKVYTLGPVIHNPQVLELLEAQGVKVVSKPEEVPEDSVVVVRAHGISPQVKQGLMRSGVTIIDATCPRVKKVQQIIKQFCQEGYTVIIVGEKEHPEVKGLMGFSQNQTWVIDKVEDLYELPPFLKPLVVAQTTQNERLFQEIADAVRKQYPEAKIFDTICHSTQERQREVREIAGKAEAFVIVGGKISGNTKRLAQIASDSGVKAYHIETEDELMSGEVKRFKTIGVTAGASTPHWVIRRVIFKLEEILSTATPLSFPYRILKLALLSNFWAALGGAGLAIVGTTLLHLKMTLSPVVALAYLWAMHLLNHFTDIQATKLKEPARVRFYKKHLHFFIIAGIVSLILSLALVSYNLWAFLFMFFMIVLGLIYNLKLPLLGRRLRDVPGSKTIMVPLAWGSLGAILPLILNHVSLFPESLFVFLYLTFIALVRTMTLDLLDLQGDQMVGRETLPIVLGERLTIKILYFTTIGIILITFLCTLLNIFPPVGLGYGIVLIAFLYYLWKIEKRNITLGILSEAALDGQLIVIGTISLLGRIT